MMQAIDATYWIGSIYNEIRLMRSDMAKSNRSINYNVGTMFAQCNQILHIQILHNDCCWSVAPWYFWIAIVLLHHNDCLCTYIASDWTVDVQICTNSRRKWVASTMNKEFHLCIWESDSLFDGCGLVSPFSCCLNINNGAMVVASSASIFWQFFLLSQRQKQMR